MPRYTPPVRDISFILQDVLDVAGSNIPGYEDLDEEFVSAVLNESGKLCEEVLAPLNTIGDVQGCVLENGIVRTPHGFKDAFEEVKSGGWPGLDCDPEFGGKAYRLCLQAL